MMRSRLLALAAASIQVLGVVAPPAVISSVAILGNPAPVFGHCPGTAIPDNGRHYAANGRSIAGSGVTADGIRADIEWTNPNICTTQGGNAMSLEVVNICNTGGCGGWVQVGWRKDQGQSGPRFYCEFHPVNGSNTIMYAPLSSSTHSYKFTYDDFDNVWDCYLNGTGKFNRTLNWYAGTWLVTQGETNTTHAQIGRNAPGKLDFLDLQYRNSSTGNWPLLDLNAPGADSPYQVSEPQPGGFRNWTNAH